MKLRLVLRGREPRWLAVLLVAIAVVIVFAATAGPIRLAGANPQAAYQRYLLTPLTSFTSMTEVLLASTPLLFTGLAVAIAFRAGYWNIGAEGQFLAGATGSVAVGFAFPGLPAALAIPAALLGGVLAGALWGVVPAWLRATWGIDEVVTTLLLNPVALLGVQALVTGPWRNSETGFAVSDSLSPSYALPTVIPDSSVHLGFPLAVVLAVVIWIVMSRTVSGLRVRAVGLSPDAAAFSGIGVKKVHFGAALVSAGIAGLGGAVQVLGVTHQLTPQVSDSYGYTGIVVATLGGLSALGVLLVGLLLGDITVGAQNASLALQLPPQMGQIISAALLLAVLAMLVFRRYRVVRAPSSASAEGGD